MKLQQQSAVLLAALLAAGTAQAAEPDYTLGYNVGVVSDYRFRGIEQSAGQPSVQGGVDWAHKSGAYLGAWAASNIRWVKDVNGASRGEYELDLYAGYKTEIKPGLGLDVGVITYQYPGNDSGQGGTPGAGQYTRADTTEAYVGVSYGVVTLKFNQSLGDFLGNRNSNGSTYTDLSANFDLGNGYTLTPHIGSQLITNASAGNYTDYALTLTKDFGKGLSAWISAVDTDAKRSFYTPSYGNTSRHLGKGTVLVGVKYSF